MASEQYTIVVALANPAAVEQLLRTASDLANRHGGRVHAVAVEHKPVTSPFLLFSDEHVAAEYADESTQVLEHATEVSNAEITTELRIDSDVPDAIRSVVDDVDANALLLGWREPSTAADAVLGTSVDPILRRPPCDTFVERMGTIADGVDRVLMPTVGGPHVELAADVVGAVALSNDARVTVLSIVTPEGRMANEEAARREVRETAAHLPDVPVDRCVENAPSSTTGILEFAEEHDLVVLSATGTGRIRPPVIGSVARTVGREVTCPVVIAKHPTESWIERALERVRSAAFAR
ncbi:amino acid transporter [Natronococcus pandeyae]|uniref:Amino acid transporter n=1 Tax=Natronococcus pandeyae TaxID=2055836 RepID=A0A8J8Q154_9EURY|nr:universal stress protein [Natronococcus pandeyae]TYL38501.1 amino acid transporter [Natronococcus pandeyae]